LKKEGGLIQKEGGLIQKEGGLIQNKVTHIALPGSDPGDDNLCSYFSEPHHHEATNTMSSVLILWQELGGGT
jgi:hypothetical protein